MKITTQVRSLIYHAQDYALDNPPLARDPNYVLDKESLSDKHLFYHPNYLVVDFDNHMF